MTEPTAIAAGDTWTWTRSGGDYPASSGWTLVYVFWNATQRFSVACTASGDDHVFELSAADSSGKVPGNYQWAAFAKRSGERHEVANGTITITPNVEGDRPFDTRTHAEKVLEAIEAVLENRATKDQEEYELDGLRLKRTPIPALQALRAAYRAEVALEREARLRAAGSGTSRYIGMRLRRA